MTAIKWWLVDSPPKGPVMRKVFPCHDVIMTTDNTTERNLGHIHAMWSTMRRVMNHIRVTWGIYPPSVVLSNKLGTNHVDATWKREGEVYLLILLLTEMLCNKQETLQERKPPPRLVWRAWNSLVRLATLLPNLSCVIIWYIYIYHETFTKPTQPP